MLQRSAGVSVFVPHLSLAGLLNRFRLNKYELMYARSGGGNLLTSISFIRSLIRDEWTSASAHEAMRMDGRILKLEIATNIV